MVVSRTDTRRLLVDSLIELTQTTPFDKITVRAITQNCGVSLRTFYNYFNDKFDVIAWQYAQAVGTSYEETLKRGGTYYDLQLRCTNSMLDVVTYFANVMKNTHGLDSFRFTMRRYNHDMLGGWLAEKTGVEDVSQVDPRLLFALDFFQCAALESMIDWATRGMPEAPETLSRWITDDMPDILKPYLM